MRWGQFLMQATCRRWQSSSATGKHSVLLSRAEADSKMCRGVSFDQLLRLGIGHATNSVRSEVCGFGIILLTYFTKSSYLTSVPKSLSAVEALNVGEIAELWVKLVDVAKTDPETQAFLVMFEPWARLRIGDRSQ